MTSNHLIIVLAWLEANGISSGLEYFVGNKAWVVLLDGVYGGEGATLAEAADVLYSSALKRHPELPKLFDA